MSKVLDDIFGDVQPLPYHRVYEAAQIVVRDYMDRHNVSIGFFAEKLGTKSKYLYTMLDPNQEKPLSVDRIIQITELTNDNRIIDALAHECGGVFNTHADAAKTHDDVRDELMAISAIAGDLSGKFLEFKNNDGVIDDNEAEALEKIALKARKELRAFEKMIHKVKG